MVLLGCGTAPALNDEGGGELPDGCCGWHGDAALDDHEVLQLGQRAHQVRQVRVPHISPGACDGARAGQGQGRSEACTHSGTHAPTHTHKQAAAAKGSDQ